MLPVLMLKILDIQGSAIFTNRIPILDPLLSGLNFHCMEGRPHFQFI